MTTGNRIRLIVNGDEQQVDDGLTLVQLLANLRVNQKHVAVEVNTCLVPRESHGEYVLAEGDAVEIVTLVGGG